MNKTDILNGVTRAFHTVGFQLKKHSPEILIVGGIIGGVASAVMACKATTKAGEILAEAKANVEGIHEVLENPELNKKYEEKYGTPYTPELSKKELAVTYVNAGKDFIKLYGPSVVLGMASIACILTSHNIIRKRNIALAAAYTVVDNGFKEYRGRVIERFGEDLDRELKYNIKAREIEEAVINEDGTTQTVTKTVETADLNEPSTYARFFDETCTGWERNSEYNLMFLRTQQSYANDLLKSKGHLFLNEVYDMLGMQRTKAGQVVGWVYDKYCPMGDNYVDFGIYDVHDERKRAFVNGHEKSILLDFNVDGNILDLLT